MFSVLRWFYCYCIYLLYMIFVNRNFSSTTHYFLQLHLSTLAVFCSTFSECATLFCSSCWNKRVVYFLLKVLWVYQSKFRQIISRNSFPTFAVFVCNISWFFMLEISEYHIFNKFLLKILWVCQVKVSANNFKKQFSDFSLNR